MKKWLCKSVSMVSLLAMLMLAAAGCGEKPADSSSAPAASEYTSSAETGSDVGSDAASEQNESNASAASTDNSKNSRPTNQNNSSGKTTTPNSTASAGSGKTPANSSNMKRFAGTTLTYATWIDPAKDEGGAVLKKFEQVTGMKVKARLTSQDSYVQDVAGLIAAGNAPDMLFCNGTFPSILSVLQPLDAAKLNLQDPIWDQSVLQGSKVGGKYYLLDTVGSVWGGANCVFYNKKLLRDNNITTPEEYYKQGKWTFAAMKKVMSDVAKLGKDYTGGWIHPVCLQAAAGASFYKYENGKFVNGIDARLIGTEKLIADCLQEGLMKDSSLNGRDDFINGKTGLVMLETFGCKKTGYWNKMNPNNVGFCYAPRYDESSPQYRSVDYRGYGLARGSKNPEATGMLLRYFLDVNNYNLKTTFLSTEAQDFFFKVTTDKKATPFHAYLTGIVTHVGGMSDQYTVYQNNIHGGTSAQVDTAINALQNVINTNVGKVNALVNETASLYK